MTRYFYLVIRSEFRYRYDVETSFELISSRLIKAFSSRKNALLYLHNLSTEFKAKYESCKVVSSPTMSNVHFITDLLGFSHGFEYVITSLELE